jgi:hypothetical protein
MRHTRPDVTIRKGVTSLEPGDQGWTCSILSLIRYKYYLNARIIYGLRTLAIGIGRASALLAL